MADELSIPSTRDIIDADFEPAVSIVPGAVPDTLIPGFKEGQSRREVPFLFIGGPLDGKVRGVHADGRHFYWRKSDDNEFASFDDHCQEFIYVPAVIQLKGRATAVYL